MISKFNISIILDIISGITTFTLTIHTFNYDVQNIINLINNEYTLS